MKQFIQAIAFATLILTGGMMTTSCDRCAGVVCNNGTCSNGVCLCADECGGSVWRLCVGVSVWLGVVVMCLVDACG